MRNWNAENLDLFWHWIAERQKIFYRRKALGREPPWTVDPILRDNHFTNVYRELDPGTIWLRRKVLNSRLYDDPQKAFLTVAYRLFGTEDVFEYLGVGDGIMGLERMAPENFRTDWVAARLQDLMDQGKQAFTPAYMVSNYGDSRPKPVVIAEVLGKIAARWEDTWSHLFMAADRKEAWQALTSLYGIGRFVGFQALVDLCYPIPGRMRQTLSGATVPSGVLPFNNDGWVAAGPGAQKGLALLLPGFKLKEDNELIAELVRIQAGPLDHKGMPWLVDDQGERLLVDRSNMQNCLCEFSKYHRLKTTNKGGRKRIFSPELAHRRDASKPLQRDPHGAILGGGTLGPAVQMDAFI